MLQRSISARREALYKARGLDMERWLDLVSEQRALQREISKIAEDYDERRAREDGEEARGEARKRERETDRDSSNEPAPDEGEQQGERRADA